MRGCGWWCERVWVVVTELVDTKRHCGERDPSLLRPSSEVQSGSNLRSDRSDG